MRSEILLVRAQRRQRRRQLLPKIGADGLLFRKSFLGEILMVITTL